MTRIAQGAVLFSDDVREETGGKSSFMGLLGPEVWVARGKPVRFVCTLIAWAIDPEVTISAEFGLENAPEGVAPPKPFTRTVTKDPEDQAEQWIIQVLGRLEFAVEDAPLGFTAKFTVGERLFESRVVFDPLPEGDPAESLS